MEGIDDGWSRRSGRLVGSRRLRVRRHEGVYLIRGGRAARRRRHLDTIRAHAAARVLLFAVKDLCGQITAVLVGTVAVADCVAALLFNSLLRCLSEMMRVCNNCTEHVHM